MSTIASKAAGADGFARVNLTWRVLLATLIALVLCVPVIGIAQNPDEPAEAPFDIAEGEPADAPFINPADEPAEQPFDQPADPRVNNKPAVAPANPLAEDPEAAVVRQTAIEYLDAIESGDAEQAASFWTVDGDLIDPSGKAVKAREMFERLAAGPRRERPKMTIKSQNLRFIRPGVALEDGSYEAAAVGDGQPVLRRFTAVWVKQDGQWLLDSVREAPLPAARNNRLAVLAWLVGDWVEESGETRTEISCKFNATKTYLLRTITVKQNGQAAFSGDQRIGWDPTTEQFRSWMFDLHGGRTEGDWRQEGDVWVVEATTVTADGTQSTSTRTYDSLDDDEFTVESSNGWSDGEPLPDFKKTFERVNSFHSK